jgi:hypothetical protein
MIRKRRKKLPSRKSRVERKGKFTAIPLPAWRAAQRMFCECCGKRYGKHVAGETTTTVRQSIDHTFPRRFVQSLKMYEHAQANLLSCCATCHGRKLQAEKPIFGGDVYQYILNLKQIGWNMQRVLEAAEFYGFRECVKFA